MYHISTSVVKFLNRKRRQLDFIMTTIFIYFYISLIQDVLRYRIRLIPPNRTLITYISI